MRMLHDSSAWGPLWLAAGPSTPSQDGSIWDRIEQALATDPDADCLSCDGQTLSRVGLAEAVAALPWGLGARRVGILMARSISAVVATLAVWRQGGVYVPMAVEYPPAQLEAIARGCALDLIVSDRRLPLDGYRETATRVGIDGTVLHLHARIAAAAPAAPEPELCYIAHTSGSTGAPKGVLIPHAALLNRIAAMRQFLAVGPDDRFLYKIPSLFDVHVWEFVLPLVAGCPLVIYRERRRFCLLAVAELLAEERITIAGFAPAMLAMLLRNEALVSDHALRVVICGGEAWAPQLAREVHARLPGVVLYNSYGPTETTMVVTNWRVPEGAGLREICLGQPHRNTVLLLEERERAITPRGLQVQGELLVGGAQVALGYVGAADEGRFVERTVEGVPMRLYRTGDMVRLDVTTGALCFQGRRDNQVKINGVRIELDEIEAALRRIPGLEGCVAFAVQDHDALQLGALFTTSRDGGPSTDEVRSHCATHLPRFKVPSVLRHVRALPLCDNGKVDRAAAARSLLPDGAAIVAGTLPAPRPGRRRWRMARPAWPGTVRPWQERGARHAGQPGL